MSPERLLSALQNEVFKKKKKIEFFLNLLFAIGHC